MTDKEIIFKSTAHPELTKLMATDPQKYQKLSQKIIDSRFDDLLPIYKRWQKNRISMPMYEISLRSIESQLERLDYSLYDKSLEGKQQLTKEFYNSYMCYSIDSILNAASKRSDVEQRKIKNLINRSSKILYMERQKVIQRIQSIYDYSPEEIENLPLMSFLPFKNPIIGIEWILRGDMDTIDDLVEDWILLLCIDEELFSSQEFLMELKKRLGESTFMKVYHHPIKYKKSHMSIHQILCLLKKEDGVDRDMSSYQLIENIPFSNFIFGKGYMKYKGYIYKNDSLPYLIPTTKYKSEIYIDIFLQNKPINHNKTDKKRRTKEGRISSNNELLELKLVNESTVSTIINEIIRINKNHNDRYLDKVMIAQNVSAVNFTIKPGVIIYANHYYLNSVKIKQDVSQSILSKIDKKFCLIKDTSPRKVKEKSKSSVNSHFIFYPANDFSYLLAECERLSENQYIPSDISYPLDGIFELPWKYVRFRDSLMYLIHPNPSKRGTTQPFIFRHPEIMRSYGDILYYIETRCDKFRVKAIDGVIVELLNFEAFRVMIPQFREYCSSVSEGIETTMMSSRKRDYTLSEFKHINTYQKSPYLSYLSSLQSESNRIYRILELVCHANSDSDIDESGFLFTINTNHAYSLIVYENISDLSRSTIVFKVYTSQYDRAIEVIRTFFANDMVNKRQKLAYGSIRFNSSSIISYHRLFHTYFSEWKSNLSSLIYRLQ